VALSSHPRGTVLRVAPADGEAPARASYTLREAPERATRRGLITAPWNLLAWPVISSGGKKRPGGGKEGREEGVDGRTRDGEGIVTTVKKLISRYVPLLWLLAVLSLVGWFIWNGDLAGWILLALVIGLMVWQLTNRERRPLRDEARRESGNGRGIRDESAP
jgi:hypothetical protein